MSRGTWMGADALSIQPRHHAGSRFERKMRVTHAERHFLEALIRNHAARFTEAFPSRYINNLYFDTPLQTFYRDHVNGVPERHKVRIRWYGDADRRSGFARRDAICHDGPSPTYLEIKSKKGWIGRKRCWALPNLESSGMLDPSIVSKLVERSECPRFVCEWVRGLEPALINRYQRRYFRSGDGKVRVTIDDDLCYFRPFGGLGCSMEGYADDAVIVEIKFDSRHAAEGRAVSQAFPIPLDKNSKYVTGMELLGGRGTTAGGRFSPLVRTIAFPRILRSVTQQRRDVAEFREHELVHR